MGQAVMNHRADWRNPNTASKEQVTFGNRRERKIVPRGRYGQQLSRAQNIMNGNRAAATVRFPENGKDVVMRFLRVAAKRILADHAVFQKDIDMRPSTKGWERTAVLRDKLKRIDILGKVGD